MLYFPLSFWCAFRTEKYYLKIIRRRNSEERRRRKSKHYRPHGLGKSLLGSRLQRTHYPGGRPGKDARKNGRWGSEF